MSSVADPHTPLTTSGGGAHPPSLDLDPLLQVFYGWVPDHKNFVKKIFSNILSAMVTRKCRCLVCNVSVSDVPVVIFWFVVIILSSYLYAT